MNYTYKQTEPTLWTVGTRDPDGTWHAESDHGSPDEAAARVRWLNGGGDDTPKPEPTTEQFDQWAIVELLGHRRLAGRVREVTLAGAGMLRLDIPATPGHGAQTQYVSPGSLYALHPTTEEIATTAAARFRPEPVSRWELEAASAAPVRASNDDEDLDDDRDPDDDDNPF